MMEGSPLFSLSEIRYVRTATILCSSHQPSCGVRMIRPWFTGPNPFDEHDSYWRINDHARESQRLRQDEKALREEFKQHCTKDHTKQTKQELALLLRRADHGLLCYAHSSVEELKHSIKTRQIRYQDMSGRNIRQHESAGPERTGLYAILDQTDAMRDFHRLLELPPDLRAEVYGYYLAPFAEQPLHALTTPPLARLNRLVRSEVLPLFFEQCTFEIPLIHVHRTFRMPIVLNMVPFAVHVSPEAALFFGAIDNDSLAQIRKLRISINQCDGYYIPRYGAPLVEPLAACNVMLAKEGSNFEIDCKHEQKPAPPYETKLAMLFTTAMDEVAKILQRLVDSKSGALERMDFRDMQALSRAVERAWDLL